MAESLPLLSFPQMDTCWITAELAEIAFIQIYLYEDYSKLPSTPTAKTFFAQIIDFDPFTEIYLCKCKQDPTEINRLIRERLTENCKKIK
jgi:hypothetical protein